MRERNGKRTKKWNEIIDEIENCDEVPEGEPERIYFRNPEFPAKLLLKR
jgi:hypothetical protein